MTSPMDDALRRTTHAVELYGVPEHLIAVAAQALEKMPADVRARAGIHAMADAILLIADEHAHLQDASGDSCGMCAVISNGLAVTAGVIRAETDLEMQRMMGDPE